MSEAEWRAFGNEFGKCINELNDELKKMPRRQKMAMLFQMRKGMREAMAQCATKPPSPKKPQAQKRKATTNLWARRK